MLELPNASAGAHDVQSFTRSALLEVRTIATLLGHASPSTTLNVYGHVVAGAQERAVAGIGEAIASAQAPLGLVGRVATALPQGHGAESQLRPPQRYWRAMAGAPQTCIKPRF